MTRSELIEVLSQRFPALTRADAAAATEVIIDSIGETLSAGDRVEIRGFGSFSTHVRAPRIGRNPKTGEKVPVPAKRVIQFKAGLELRERVERAGRRS